MYILYEEKFNYYVYEKKYRSVSVVYLNVVDNESIFLRNEYLNFL